MRKILNLRQIFDITLGVMIIGTLVFFVAFGSCLLIAKKEAKRETDAMIQRNIAYVQEHINGELSRVEDAAYTLASNTFGDLVRNADGSSHVAINPNTFHQPTEEEIYLMMENFLRANPHIVGVIVAFEPYIYPQLNAEHGYAPYVKRTGDELVRYEIGSIVDYRQKDWYNIPAQTGHQYWTDPFKEKTQQQLVAAFVIPLYGYGDRFVGCMALTIDVNDFAQRLRDAAPYDGAELILLSDSVDYYATQPFHYVFTNRHSGGTYMLVCPEKEVMGGVERMQDQIVIIGAISIVVMIFCFIFLFRHMQKIQMAKSSMESELHIASAIQMAMLPKGHPDFPERKELDLHGFLRPAKSVGGDLYDYFIQEDKLFFAVGDVSGKGVPAALFMAVVRALFRNIAKLTSDPAHIASSLNNALNEGNETNMFCTMFMGVLDLKSGQLNYCNAGHNAPIIRRRLPDSKPSAPQHQVSFMKPQTNIPLGMFPNFPFQSEQATLLPGEALLIYTDGVTEAENREHQLFGEKAVLETLRRTREANLTSARQFVEQLVDAIDHHASGTEQSDDITLLIIDYLGGLNN